MAETRAAGEARAPSRRAHRHRACRTHLRRRTWPLWAVKHGRSTKPARGGGLGPSDGNVASYTKECVPKVLEQEGGTCEHFKKGTVAAVFRWFGRKAWMGQGTQGTSAEIQVK